MPLCSLQAVSKVCARPRLRPCLPQRRHCMAAAWQTMCSFVQLCEPPRFPAISSFSSSLCCSQPHLAALLAALPLLSPHFCVLAPCHLSVDSVQTIHKTRVPIIAIANDKFSTKLRSLRNHCLELDFRK